MNVSARQRGFTLIELMITVAIIAIISMIAMPSYRDYVERANRSAATSYLLEVANLQERRFLDARAYAADMTALGASPPSEVATNYTVTTAGDNTTAPPSYTITATPKSSGTQSGDSCGTLTLNSQGEKGHASGASRCWN
ncbi:type IV pilus assembly protein PilE [gamma proteobacterium BDW918]|uniref:Pilus assembly protein PilE n=1 Tax=Zhongshania aliphaticivorans TaxID=1470434 RepID=A0A127M849_9GAMM|nr:type IV pilin protein [Zhongshania aliphaticivorans]AMO69385.1 pilus assembly protein PilE [Zhongshania aliphaticivorans]EIF42476.1 type IV pilus assembly protein PilE [gamma proteobacterium BDW918]|tara:strand:+ start:203 stop:622 length:420 start_codon:yes stop_codon:yes gene_type:complete